jgi:hypothetical protein
MTRASKMVQTMQKSSIRYVHQMAIYSYIITREWSDPTCRNLPWYFFFTAIVHTTKSTVNILAANTHCKYFLKIAEHCQYCNLPDPWRNVHPSTAGAGQRSMQHATWLTEPRRMLQRSRDETAQRVVQTSGTSGSAYRKMSNFSNF